MLVAWLELVVIMLPLPRELHEWRQSNRRNRNAERQFRPARSRATIQLVEGGGSREGVEASGVSWVVWNLLRRIAQKRSRQ
jgi:hypothetical protein